MQQKSKKNYIIPLISLSMFIILTFGAAYAYYISNTTMGTANYQVTLPKTTSLICTKTDCGVTATPAMMAESNTSSSEAKDSSTCSVTCTCDGSAGAVCNYDVYLLEKGSIYTPSTGIGNNKEFTAQLSLPTSCTAENDSTTETSVYTLKNKKVASCSITIPSGMNSFVGAVNATFRIYNPNIDQAEMAGKSYRYYLVAGDELPSNYVRKDYLVSSGGAYIDTGYYWQHENIEIYLDAIVTSNSSSQSLFGNEEYTSSGSNRNFAGIPYGANGSYAIYLGSTSQGTVTPGTNTRFNLRILTDASKNIQVFLNGTRKINKTYSGSVLTRQTAYTSSSTSTNVGHIFLYSNHNSVRGSTNAGTQAVGAMKVYAFKLIDNNVMVRDFIPCTNTDTGVDGLYDTISKTFFTNSNSSGTLTAGND